MLTFISVSVSVFRILEAARCSHVTDAGFTVLARVTFNFAFTHSFDLNLSDLN